MTDSNTTVASGATQAAGTSTQMAGGNAAPPQQIGGDAGGTISAAHPAPGSTIAAGAAPGGTVTAGNVQTAAVMNGSAAGMTAVASATAVASQAQAGSGPRATFDLSQRKSITIHGRTYTIDKLIGNGGEAEVYVLVNEGRKYALKLYRGVHGFNKDLIGRLARLRGMAAVTDIYGYGNITIGSEKRSFTLMEYCQDGSTASWDFKGNGDAILQIVTLAARNLNELHKAGVLHKDTKPENLLFTDKQNCLLLLSDFGISDILGADGSVNSLQDRTPIYAAPEIYTKASIINGATYAIMTSAYDFYALGMTALALWMGADAFKRKETELVKLKLEGKIDVPKSMPEPLRTIVRGLLLNDVENRWGFDEIQRKLSGEDVPVGENAGALNVVFDSSKNKTARNTAELARFMMEDQELGINYLYKGRVCEWLRKSMPEVEIRINDIIETRYPKNRVAGLYAAALVLDPNLPYYDTKGKTHDSIIPLLNAEPGFSDKLTDPDNPIYVYFRHSEGKQWTDQLFQRVKAAAADQFGQARSTLIWAVHDSEIYRNFSGKKSADEQKFTEVSCHNPAEVLKFFSDYRIVSDDDKKWICSLAFVEMLRTYSPDDAAKVEKFRQQNASDGFQRLYRYIIQLLNPAADINLCANPEDPWYAMTGQGLGKIINMAFNAYYVQFEGDRDRLYDQWNSADNPYRNLCQASFVDLVVMSFRGGWKDSYLQKSFRTKGSRFDAHDKWAAYCTDYKSTDNTKKYGPYDVQIAIMKTIAGFRHAPEYRFRGSSETVSDISGLKALAGSHKEGKNWKDEIARAVKTRSLHAWLAVQYQENPDADLKPKYAYEKLTEQYVEMLGKCDPDNREYLRYTQAHGSIRKDAKAQPIFILGALQNIFVVACALFFFVSIASQVLGIIQMPWLDYGLKKEIYVLFGPIVFCLLLCQFFSEDRVFGFFQSIFAFFVFMLILYFASRWFIWRLVPYIALAATGLFAWYFLSRLFKPNEGASGLRSLGSPDQDMLILEPLHFAFKSSASTFQSSNAANEDFYKEQYKDSLKDKLRPMILGCITGFILMGNGAAAYSMVEKEQARNEAESVSVTTKALTVDGNEYEVMATCSAQDVHAEFIGSRRTAEDSLLVRFRLINGGEHEIAPDIRASIPLQKTGRIEAEDDAGRIYRFRDGEISVSAPGVTIDNSNKSGFFALPAGETAECSVTLSNVGPDASRLELLTIPARGLEGGTKRGHIIFSDIPIPKNISR